MLLLQFNNVNNLNSSLQVGDEVYGVDTTSQFQGADSEAVADTGKAQRLGILRMIDQTANNTLPVVNGTYFLFVDQTMVVNAPTPTKSTFIMFSKANLGDSGLVGYYAEAKLTNDSIVKAELFSIGSEVILNSK